MYQKRFSSLTVCTQRSCITILQVSVLTHLSGVELLLSLPSVARSGKKKSPLPSLDHSPVFQFGGPQSPQPHAVSPQVVSLPWLPFVQEVFRCCLLSSTHTSASSSRNTLTWYTHQKVFLLALAQICVRSNRWNICPLTPPTTNRESSLATRRLYIPRSFLPFQVEAPKNELRFDRTLCPPKEL